MKYEDDFGDEVDTEQLYKCDCGWVGIVSEMDGCFDCGDEYDAIYSKYCCPKCGAFHLFITGYEKVVDWEPTINKILEERDDVWKELADH
jgi:predicted RNA-binding Zn-ribbon protein involved in translation (DUF1610 family)